VNSRFKILASVVVAASLVLSVSLLPLFSPATAASKPDAAQQVQKLAASGKLAEASWFLEDQEKLTLTEVYLTLTDLDQEANPGTPEAFIDLIIIQAQLVEVCEEYAGEEYCYYEYLPSMEFYGYAELEDSDFKISNNVRTASIAGSEVSGTDYFSGEEKTIIVDATWKADSALTKIKQSIAESDDGYKLTYKLSGIGRDAIANLQIGGDIEMTLGPSPYSDASILKAKQGYMIRELKQ
jgi:hypothetical protein